MGIEHTSSRVRWSITPARSRATTPRVVGIAGPAESDR